MILVLFCIQGLNYRSNIIHTSHYVTMRVISRIEYTVNGFNHVTLSLRNLYYGKYATNFIKPVQNQLKPNYPSCDYMSLIVVILKIYFQQ